MVILRIAGSAHRADVDVQAWSTVEVREGMAARWSLVAAGVGIGESNTDETKGQPDK
jgi:hypothetical protein